ncbi:MAG: hypothetical protein ABFS32_22055 [Bacteroidota bacterium]
MAKFIANNVFTVSGKLPVYISGMIVDGVINIGDYLHSPINASSYLKGIITSIEFADGKYDSFTCIGLECNSPDDQKTWLDINIKQGDTLEISTNT